MREVYPTPSSMLRLAIPALLIVQFVVWPFAAQRSLHAGMVAAEVTLLALLAAGIRLQHRTATDVLLLNATAPRGLALAVVAGLAASIAIPQLDCLWRALLAQIGLAAPLGVQRTMLQVHLVRGPGEALIALAGIALLPAVSEELLFRGYVFTSLHAHRGPGAAVGGAALVFALAHFNPWQLPALFVFGLFLGWLILETHSVYAAIVAHLANNLVAFGAVNLHAYSGVEQFHPLMPLPMPATFLAAVLLVAALALLRRVPPLVPLERVPRAPGDHTLTEPPSA